MTRPSGPLFLLCLVVISPKMADSTSVSVGISDGIVVLSVLYPPYLVPLPPKTSSCFPNVRRGYIVNPPTERRSGAPMRLTQLPTENFLGYSVFMVSYRAKLISLVGRAS